MRRKVHFTGIIAEKFGDSFTMEADSYSDIFKCIEVNRPGFRKYLLECHESQTGFVVETAGNSIDEDDLFLPVKEGDVTLSIIPAGSKSGVGKILAAIAIIAIMIAMPQIGAAGSLYVAGATTLSTGVMIATSIAINLALAGLQQLMAPDPSVDSDNPTNYLFNGNSQNILEGDPVPILYGELRVPGRAISVEAISGTYRNNNVTIDSGNNMYLYKQEVEAETK